MLKILQINSGITRSTGSIAQAIGEQVLACGWDSWIMYSARNPESPCKSQYYRIGSPLVSKIHAVLTRLFDMHGLGSYFSTRNLIKKIKELDPDIIHLHNIHGYYINYSLLFTYLSRANIPVVWTLHDCWSMTGHCSHFDAIGCMKWKKGCSKCALKTDYPSSVLFDNSRCNWNQKNKIFNSVPNLTIVPVSTWVESVVKESYLKKYPTHVIHNGIDLDIFKISENSIVRDRHNIGNRTIVLGVATGWFEGGGLRRFNEFMKLSSILDDNYRIILIGLEESQLQGLPNNVIGLQRTANQQELAEYYSAADVFINPTYQDSLPTVNMEALACGTPVITYRTGGSPEILDKETGWVTDKGNVEALAFYVQDVRKQSNKEKVAQKNACRKRAVLYFNKYDRFYDYVNLYKQILHL